MPSAGGHIIITSRNHLWQSSSDAIEVNVFTREESIALLRRQGDRQRAEPMTVAEADRLAETLGDLPLALDAEVAVL